MAIVIKKIVSEIGEKRFLVKAKHCNEDLKVYVADQRDFIETNLNKEITFEMGYDEIMDWKIINSFNGEDSGLFRRQENTIVRGRIRNYTKNTTKK